MSRSQPFKCLRPESRQRRIFGVRHAGHPSDAYAPSSPMTTLVELGYFAVARRAPGARVGSTPNMQSLSPR